MKMLADTGALLAFHVRRDQHHARAVAFLREHPEVQFVLTDLILAELVTRARARRSAAEAADAGRKYLASRRFMVLYVDAPLDTSGHASNSSPISASGSQIASASK